MIPEEDIDFLKRIVGDQIWWKDIPGFEGCYQVSNDGQIKSLERHVENGSPKGMILPEKILKQEVSKAEYNQVSLTKEGHRKVSYVHRLVADAFIPIRYGPTVNHIDGDKRNNTAINLEFISYAENNQHAYDTGLHGKGENHYSSKLTNEQVKEIRKFGKYDSYANIAKKYGVSEGIIIDVLTNKTYKNI